VAGVRNFREVHTALRQFYGSGSSVKYTLARMRALLEFVGNPQDGLQVVHVAGTSGKTSTAYYTAALLKQAGAKVGLTVSPHVDEVNERLQIDLLPMPERQFCVALEDFLGLVGRSDIHPSYFELMIAFAFCEFSKQAVDYAVVEVGLGGLLDATNTVSRTDKVCVITDIGLDHTEILGDSLAAIAVQKAGIIQPHNHIFMHEQSPEVMEAVVRTVTEKKAVLHIAESVCLPEAKALPLFQQRNFGLAHTAASFVLARDNRPLLKPPAVQAAAATYVPARMEIIKNTGTLILDGAHNAQKIGQLLQSIRAQFGDQLITALVAFVGGRDSRWQQALDVLLPEVSQLIITTFKTDQDVPKTAVDPKRLAAYCTSQQASADCLIEADPVKAYQLLASDPASLKLVVGSFYLLNHIRPWVGL
jgi:dihydrofolate synthase/folylpolyglutamate synthase